MPKDFIYTSNTSAVREVKSSGMLYFPFSDNTASYRNFLPSTEDLYKAVIRAKSSGFVTTKKLGSSSTQDLYGSAK